MPTPEFVAMPEWFRFRCVDMNHEPCATCPRDFLINAGYIKAVHKATDGRALVLVNSHNYCPMPMCEGRLQFIETTVLFDELIAGLPGNVTDIGNVNMVTLSYVNKG